MSDGANDAAVEGALAAIELRRVLQSRDHILEREGRGLMVLNV